MKKNVYCRFTCDVMQKSQNAQLKNLWVANVL